MSRHAVTMREMPTSNPANMLPVNEAPLLQA
jgi:hypothetical protein